MGMHENNPIQPVNACSSAVDPRRLYPAHFDLMRNLYHSGQQPERWRMLDAAEVRLDEDGMEVEFTLVQHGTDRCGTAASWSAPGQLVRIVAV